MASLVPSQPRPEWEQVASAHIPELSDDQYALEVLRLPAGKSEEQDEQDVVTRASALGIEIRLPDNNQSRKTASSAQSASTLDSYHARTFSTVSIHSANTALTAYSSLFGPPIPEFASHGPPVKPRPRDINFAQYDRYLSQIGPHLDQPKLRKAPIPAETSARSLFSVRTKHSLFSVKSGIMRGMRWSRRPSRPFDPPMACICCRDDHGKKSTTLSLPCGHPYCSSCLQVMIKQAATDESKMPPRCCTLPIPGSTIKSLLDESEQESFLKAVVQFGTPWEDRIFCPSSTCGQFIPPRRRVDAKYPFGVTCRKCHTRACVMCKRPAHPPGEDCPEDWELEAVLKMGEKSGWRRCYQCRNLVELSQGCTHMICRCKAQFCYICGAVWDAAIGCPNYCKGEEELERRRLNEENRMARLLAERAAEEAAADAESAERAEAEARSRNHPEFQRLKQTQEEQMRRFSDFMGKAKGSYQSRFSAEKLSLVDKHLDQEEKTKERHAKTVAHLEDRQIAAEMELRASLEQSERSVKIRLKHMEAYCDGLGRSSPDSKMPARNVTERDLRELGQQYNVRDDMARLHQSKINVMRDRQAKRMEELIDRQEDELQKLREKRREDIEDLAARFAHEEDIMNVVFRARQQRLKRRWEVSIEILQQTLSDRDNVKYGRVPPPPWPEEASSCEDTLVEVAEK